MEDLEKRLGLKKASEGHMSWVTQSYNAPRFFKNEQHELLLGRQFDGNQDRNQFWRNRYGRLFVDSQFNLVHIVGNLLSTARSFLSTQDSDEQKQQYEQPMIRDLRLLNSSLDENWHMYLKGQIDNGGHIYANGRAVVSNREVRADIIKLKAKALGAYVNLLIMGADSQDFKAGAKELVDFYLQKIEPKYRGYDTKLIPMTKQQQNAKT